MSTKCVVCHSEFSDDRGQREVPTCPSCLSKLSEPPKLVDGWVVLNDVDLAKFYDYDVDFEIDYRNA